MIYLKKFETHQDYEAYIQDRQNLVLPNVSFCEDTPNEVHYNPTFFCKLTLNDDSVVDIEGSGELTQAMTASYKTTCVSAEIGESCTSIGNSAFYTCTSLQNITISNSVTSIGNAAFQNCSGLTSVTIPSGVTSIGNAAFQGCSGLISVTIGNGVTSIGDGAFTTCRGLTSVTIGSGVTSIGQGAFSNCSGLSEITSYIMEAPSVRPGTFYYVSNGGTLYVPIGSSGYDTWMNDQGNLGLYEWTKEEQ